MIHKIAWRNIWRKKSRAVAILLAVVSGLTGALFAIGFSSSYTNQFIDSVIDYQSAHLVLQHSSFSENHDARYYINDTDDIKAVLAGDPLIEAVSARIRLNGYVSTAYSSFAMNFYGIDPAEDTLVFKLHRRIPEATGSFFGGETASPILIGQALADRLELGPGDRIVSTFQTREGDITSAAFRVAGIYSVDNKLLETSFVYVLKDELASLGGYDAGASHEVAIRLTRGLRDMDRAQGLVSELIPGHRLVRWEEIRMDVAFLYLYVDLLVIVFVGIVLFALCLGIVNTMLMAILERGHELGMLRTIGMSDRKVFFMLMLEVILLICTGALISMGISSVLMMWLGNVGIGFAYSPNSLFYTAYALERIYPAIRPDQYLSMILFVIVTGMVASIFPAKKVLSKRPAEAVKRLI